MTYKQYKKNTNYLILDYAEDLFIIIKNNAKFFELSIAFISSLDDILFVSWL